MEKLIRRWWWKLLGVLILVYVFIAGMLVPLKPGILRVDPAAGSTGGLLSVVVEGYNTHFASAENLRVWLKMDDEHTLVADSITATNERRVRVEFRIPEYLPSAERVQPFALIIDNERDGAFVRPNSVLITQDSIDPERGALVWTNQDPTKLNQREGITFPFRNILGETIRNTYFHVSLWLAMMIIFIAAVVFSIRYLQRPERAEADHWAQSLTAAGVLFGVLGLVTGAVWARYTWGSWWSWDPKQFTALIAIMIYLGYFVLRAAFPDPQQRARIAAVYNIFAFAALVPLIYILPRMVDSLHPGSGGNPALGGEDLDNTMRMVFYPAIIGWTLIGSWLASIYYRARKLEERLIDAEW
jgi:heme exporter protein C